MNDVRKPLYQMYEIRHPPHPNEKWIFSFCVFFFFTSRVQTPTYKIAYPRKIETRGTFFCGAYHCSAGIRPAAVHKPREKKTLGFKIF